VSAPLSLYTIRRDHQLDCGCGIKPGCGRCVVCKQPWPCDAIRTVSVLEATREALKEASSLFNLGYNVCQAPTNGKKDSSGVRKREYEKVADRLIDRINAAMDLATSRKPTPNPA
jgi:hypothetical protein